MDEAVEAAVLLLERMLKTELRLPDAAFRRRSGECMPSASNESEHCDVVIESETDVRLGDSRKGESTDDCLERERVSLLWNENIAWKVRQRPLKVHQ